MTHASARTPLILSRQDGMRPIVKALREGRALYFLPDMDFGARDALFIGWDQQLVLDYQ